MFTDLFKKISFSFIGDDKMSSSVRNTYFLKKIYIIIIIGLYLIVENIILIYDKIQF